MFKTNPLLLKDFYKAVHLQMIPQNMIKSVSYYTPRMSRVKQWNSVVNFGLQAFCKTYLIDYFNENFFNRPKEEVIGEYKKYMENTLGKNVCTYDKIEKLYDLGYLPIEIFSLPEGLKVPIHVPIFGITNTHPDFAWLGQALESLISAEMWYPMICATVGNTYREIVDYWYNKTCEDNVPRRRALGNFDFRGDQGLDAALKAGSAWCLSFVNTATVPVVPYLEKNYNCNCETEEVGFGAVSTEHFVMCSNSAKDTAENPNYEYADIDPYRERIFLKKLLTELYPNTSFSCVCDSYDYWNVVENILPTLKDEILNHNGCFLVRGDSGDCVKVVTETVFKLWDIFGGTVNSKGYKVLNPHVKALYGDGITTKRAEEIYQILEENGFAAQNVSLGVGSLSMHAIEDEIDLHLKSCETDFEDVLYHTTLFNPFTRDTFGVAIKACYAEFLNEDGTVTKMPIFKDPKTDREKGGGNFKKSHKGCCKVFWRDKWNKIVTYIDELTWDEASQDDNLMQTIFKNGEMVKEETLSEIRNRLNWNKF